MKIVILTAMYLPEETGGIEIATYNIAKRLVKKKHEVHIITSTKKLSSENESEGINVYRITYPRVNFFGVLIFWIKCLFLLQKIHPDVAHSQSIQMGPPCFLAKKLFGIPYIVYCHGGDVYPLWKFKKTISKLVLENAQATVALTEDMQKKIESFGFHVKNIFVIPNGIELEKFKNLSKVNIRRELKIGEAQGVIIFVGTLTPRKGIKYLIEAMNIIREKKPDVKLLLIGDGDQKQDLEKLSERLNLKKSINFIGNIDNMEIPEYMTASDVFVLPSTLEGLPVVILEALASGLPIVTTKIDGMSEIVEDGINGFLVQPKNSEQIAEKILLLLENNELREITEKNNREKVEEYNWENIIDRIEKTYSEVITKNDLSD